MLLSDGVKVSRLTSGFYGRSKYGFGTVLVLSSFARATCQYTATDGLGESAVAEWSKGALGTAVLRGFIDLVQDNPQHVRVSNRIYSETNHAFYFNEHLST